MKIRKMCEADAEAVAELEKECFSSPWSSKALIDTMSAGQACFLVAEDTEGICGYVGMTFAAGEGEITDIAVAARARRQGVARRLLESLFAESGLLETGEIFLDVRVSNAPAIALYEGAGFVLCGRRRNFYSLPAEDALIYKKELSRER